MADNRFSIPLDQLADLVMADVETVARKATLDLFAKVVQRSPVDTGRFRANWNVSYGAPDVTFTDSTNQTRGAAEAAKALTLPVGGVQWLANGLPYSEKLEYGYSKQAPSGMVRISAQEFVDHVSRALKS